MSASARPEPAAWDVSILHTFMIDGSLPTITRGDIGGVGQLNLSGTKADLFRVHERATFLIREGRTGEFGLYCTTLAEQGRIDEEVKLPGDEAAQTLLQRVVEIKPITQHHAPIAKLLLEAKANPNVDNESGLIIHSSNLFPKTEARLSLLRAIVSGPIPIDFSEPTSAGYILHRYVKKGFVDGCRVLIEGKADVNIRESEDCVGRFTGLMFSVIYCQPKITQLLLESKAEPLFETTEGTTAITAGECFQQPLICAKVEECRELIRQYLTPILFTELNSSLTRDTSGVVIAYLCTSPVRMN